MGDLIFQRIESEIRADLLEKAQAILDQPASNPGFTSIDRWEAEYNLARALQIDGRSQAAYERVERLLATPTPSGLDPELRGRMAWLLTPPSEISIAAARCTPSYSSGASRIGS